MSISIRKIYNSVAKDLRFYQNNFLLMQIIQMEKFKDRLEFQIP